MTERMQLEQAIVQLESQRAALGDATADVAIAGLKLKLAGLEQPEASGERKLVTIMFADISGFTALSEKMDPETVRDLMNRCFDRLVPCIRRYDGTIDKFMGDGVMALFGAPHVHENDAERALRAALAMQAALVAFNSEHHLQLGIHFGVNTGLVLAGGIGSSGQQGYSVMGDAVNLAARLEDVSERGQILVGGDTYHLTAPLFEFEALAPVSVKGKAEPVAVYRLHGAKAGGGTVRGLERQGLSSPLVGRGPELETLNGAVARLAAGQGGILSVIGEAGLGKSRLMAEVRRGASGEPGVQWLEGKALSFGQTISYWPFQEIVRAYAGLLEEDTELAAWQKLEGKIVALFPDTALDILPYLATVLAVEVQGGYVERVKHLEGEALSLRVFLAMRRFLERLARAQPLALVFEDLHWIDASSAELLEFLLPLTREAPLLLIGVSRPDPGTAGARLRATCAEKYTESYTELRLVPLSQSESTQLVNNLLAIDDLPARVREAMTQKAEGNPFFIEEIIRSLLDLGAIVREPATGRWRATAQIEAVHIPDTVQGVLMARIDRLDDDLKQALRMAAVIGRTFLYRILREVDAADGALEAHLAQLQQIELIREKQAAAELEYMFKHALAQEATYESILLQKRRDLHGRVAAAIEALFAERLDEFYGLLAYHYAKAENWAQAQAYLFKAGDQAGRMAADAEALAHYQQAMEVYAKAFGDKWEPVQRAQLERKMGEALHRRGENRQAVEYYRRALALLGHPLPQTRRGGQYALAGEVLQQVFRRLFTKTAAPGARPERNPAVDEELRLYDYLSAAALHTMPEEVPLLMLRGLNRAEAENAVGEIAVGMASVCNFGIALNMPWLSELYYNRASALAPGVTEVFKLAFIHVWSGVYLLGCGRLAEAAQHLTQSAELARTIGAIFEECATESWLASIKFWQGELLSSRTLWEKFVALGREIQSQNLECFGLGGAANCSSVLGDRENVVEQIQASTELSKKVPNYLNHVKVLGYLGAHYLRVGQVDEALACSEEAGRLIEKSKTSGWWNMYAYNAYVEACLVKAEQSKAEQGQWLNKAKVWLDKGLKQGQSGRPELTEAQRLRGRYEWLRGHAAAARQWWARSLQGAEAMGLRYYAARTHLDMGQYLGDKAHVQKAVDIFSEVGARLDLEKARGVLEAGDGREEAV